MKTLIPIFLLVTACGSIGPQSGIYKITDVSVENSCVFFERYLDDPTGEEVETTISEDATNVTVFDTDCPLDGTTFHCVWPEDHWSEEGLPDGAAIFYLPEFEGTWTDSNEIDATESVTFTCSGSGCDGFLAESCFVAFDYSLVLLE